MGIAVLDSTEAEARVVQGLITGSGFVGGGSTPDSEDDADDD